MIKRVLFLILILTLLIPLKSFGLDYKFESKDLSAIDFDKTTKKIESLGFFPAYQSILGGMPILNVDQVFVKSTSDSAIFYKQNIRVSESKINKLIPVNEGLVLHLKNQKGLFEAFYFYNIKREEVHKISESMIHGSREPASSLNLINCCDSVHNEDGSRNKKMGLMDSVVAAKIKTCVYSSLKSLKSTAQQKLNSLKNMTAESFWKSVVDSYNSMGEFVKNIHKIIPDVKQILESTDPEIIGEVLCQVSGGLFAGFITSGLSAAALGKNISVVLLNLSKMKKMLLQVTKLKIKNPNIDISDMISCGVAL